MQMRRIRVIFLLLILLIVSGGRVSAQKYSCVQTDPITGLVTINWDFSNYLPIDHFTLYWGPAPGLWSDSASIIPSGPPETFTIPGSDGNVNIYYIQIRTFDPTGANWFDTAVSNILLSVMPYDNGGVAYLSWNLQGVFSSGNYYIQLFDNPAWRTVDTMKFDPLKPQTFYYDTISSPFCDTTNLHYRLLFNEGTGNCSYISNVDSSNFLDVNPPGNPSLDTVSIYYDPSGFYVCPIIGWAKSPQHDVAGYIIYRLTNGVFDSIATVPSDSSTFVDLSIGALQGCLDPQTYALVAIDSCGNTSYGTYMEAPHTLTLQVMNDIDPCDKKVSLQWNEYDFMPGGLAGYEVYRGINSVMNFTLIASLPPGDTAYTDSYDFTDGSSYTYFVKAVSNNGFSSSSSCRQIKTYHGPLLPDTLYIEYATVVNDAYVNLKYYYSPPNTIKKVILERSEIPFGTNWTYSGNYLTIDSLVAPPGGYLPVEWEFNDTSALVHYNSYQYRLLIVDTACTQAIDTSVNIARSILLMAYIVDDTHNQISWNSYDRWFGGVDHYEVFRNIDGTDDPLNPIATFSNDTVYVDDITGISLTSTVCYRVEAVEGPGNPVIPGVRSVSNWACVIRDPLFYMPNAFKPNSTNNNTFRPVATFVEPSSFNMQIYSRWGQLVFETGSMLFGWDGTINNLPAPAGVYAWVVTYRSLLGKEYTRRGFVTLVR
jgi:gliding motility-associated-like protein